MSDTEAKKLIPKHIIIIMDGNGRWAQNKGLPRSAGHAAGVKSVRSTVELCAKYGIESLTLFAFSSENWRRPLAEVTLLMELFIKALSREVRRLKKNNIRLRIVGDRSAFDEKLQMLIDSSEQQTMECTGLNLNIAANYGGQWDITQATQKMAKKVVDGQLGCNHITDSTLQAEMSLSAQVEPDLFIRTGGEIRISNFMLWQLAYTELYFTPIFWPDFNKQELQKAIDEFASRQRRFGHTQEQVK